MNDCETMNLKGLFLGGYEGTPFNILCHTKNLSKKSMNWIRILLIHLFSRSNSKALLDKISTTDPKVTSWKPTGHWFTFKYNLDF